MKDVRLNWVDFRLRLRDVFDRYGAQRAGQLIFRGMADSRWPLLTTLDRLVVTASSSDRQARFDTILSRFKREAILGGFAGGQFPEGTPMELLARHHGLPSPLLDWSESPYVASYFAFSDAARERSRHVAVWMLDRTRLPERTTIEIIDDYMLIRFNRRALSQRGIFVRVAECRPLEELIPDALTKFVIPARDARHAIGELAWMTVTGTSLMCDLDGAARTAHELSEFTWSEP